MEKPLTTKQSKTLTVLASLALAVLVVASIGSLYLGQNDVKAQETTNTPETVNPPEKTISVTGIATSSSAPNLLVIQFGMETQEITAKEALDKNSLAMNQVIDAIKSTGISSEEISTTNFNIYPVYEGYEEELTKRWKQELVGYRVANTITVETTKLNSAADIIDGSVAAGANRVDSVYFTLSPERQLELTDNLIGKAIENAQEKAEKALAPLNHKIIGVKMVSLSEFGYPPPMPAFEESYDGMSSKSFAPTPIFSSEQDLSTTANVVFLIGRN